MKEMETKKLYNSITNIKDEFIEEAQTVRPKRKSSSWVRWGAVAACLCLIAGTFLWFRDSSEEVKSIENLEEITASYSGNLLAEKLLSSGARTTSILLRYNSSGDAADPAAWNTLSITGDYNGQDFTLDCDFDGIRDGNDPAEVWAVTQYGDVEVTIYRQEDSGWSDPYLYRACFTLDGIAYDLSIHSNDPEEIYIYLDMVLGNPEDEEAQAGVILNDVLGFGLCHVVMEEISPYQYEWHYYVEVDGEDVCVAEQFGYDDPQAWNRDLDGDGVNELICNCTYGDGVQAVIVYRNNNGVIEEGRIRWNYYDEAFGWTDIGMGGVSSLPVECYDPERDVFTATDYYTNGYDNPVTAEFNDGFIPFDFSPFKHMP